MSILPKVIYRFNTNSIKIPTVFFTELEQITQKFIWNHKRLPNSHSNLEKEEQSWRIIADIKLYYKAMVIKTVWYWPKNR